mgnify:CR=1 FL=1
MNIFTIMADNSELDNSTGYVFNISDNPVDLAQMTIQILDDAGVVFRSYFPKELDTILEKSYSDDHELIFQADDEIYNFHYTSIVQRMYNNYIDIYGFYLSCLPPINTKQYICYPLLFKFDSLEEMLMKLALCKVKKLNPIFDFNVFKMSTESRCKFLIAEIIKTADEYNIPSKQTYMIC